MWYFAWILGTGFAIVFSILLGVWFEYTQQDEGSGSRCL